MKTDLVKSERDTALVTVDLSLVDDWLDYMAKAEGATPATVQAYQKGMCVFVSWLRETGNVGNVTPMVLVDYKAWLATTYSPQTVNLRLSAVRSFYRWLVNTGHAPTSPGACVKGMKRPKATTHKRDTLTNGEVVAVMETCERGTPRGDRDAAIMSLMVYCGLRTIEIHRASVGNLKTQDDRLVLEVQGKGRLTADEVAVIPRNQEPTIRAWVGQRQHLPGLGDDAPLFVNLSNRNGGGRMTTRVIRRMVKERYARAGVVGRRKSTHSLRHSAITNAIRHGATPLQAQAMARHASFDTTKGYYHEVGRIENPAEDLIDYGVS